MAYVIELLTPSSTLQAHAQYLWKPPYIVITEKLIEPTCTKLAEKDCNYATGYYVQVFSFPHNNHTSIQNSVPHAPSVYFQKYPNSTTSGDYHSSRWRVLLMQLWKYKEKHYLHACGTSKINYSLYTSYTDSTQDRDEDDDEDED